MQHIMNITVWAVLSAGILLASQAQAGRFIGLIEAETFAPGVGEVIQVGNWQREKVGEDKMSATNIQLAMEFGLASRFHVGMALPAFSDLRGAGHRNTKFGGTSLWGVYNFSRPTNTNLGISCCVGMIECNENLALELHLILEKAWESLVFVMNLTAGRVWMHEVSADDHEFLIGRLGASQNLGRSFSLAVEVESCLKHQDDTNHHSDEVKIGSSVVWNGEKVWVLSGLVFDTYSESNVQGAALQFQAGIPF